MAEIKTTNIPIPKELPLMALKNTVLFPKLIIPIIIQRSKSMAALESALASDKLVFFATQKNIEDNITKEDLYEIGTIGRVISIFKMPDGTAKVDVEGLVRARIEEFVSNEPYFKVKIQPFNLILRNSLEEKAMLRSVIDQFRNLSNIRSYPNALPDVIYMMAQLKDTEQIIGLTVVNINVDTDEQQKVLEYESAMDALRELNMLLAREAEILEAEKSVAKETKKQIGKMQKEMLNN